MYTSPATSTSTRVIPRQLYQQPSQLVPVQQRSRAAPVRRRRGSKSAFNIRTLKAEYREIQRRWESGSYDTLEDQDAIRSLLPKTTFYKRRPIVELHIVDAAEFDATLDEFLHTNGVMKQEQFFDLCSSLFQRADIKKRKAIAKMAGRIM